MIPDFPEKLGELLINEDDCECQYAALYVLIHLDILVAREFFERVESKFQFLEKPLQLITADYIRKLSIINCGGIGIESNDLLNFALKLINDPIYDTSSKFELINVIFNSGALFVLDNQCILNLTLILQRILVKENNLVCQILIFKTFEKVLERFPINNETLCTEILFLLNSSHFQIKKLAIQCSIKTFNPSSSKQALTLISDYLGKIDLEAEELFIDHLSDIFNFIREIFGRTHDHLLVEFAITKIFFPLLKKMENTKSEIFCDILRTLKSILNLSPLSDYFDFINRFLEENLYILSDPKIFSVVLLLLGEIIPENDMKTVPKILVKLKILLVSFQSEIGFNTDNESINSKEKLQCNSFNYLHLYYLSLFFIKILSTNLYSSDSKLLNKIKAEMLIILCELMKTPRKGSNLSSKNHEIYDQILLNMKLIECLNLKTRMDFISTTEATEDELYTKSGRCDTEISFNILRRMNRDIQRVDEFERNLTSSKQEMVRIKKSNRFKNIMQLSGSSDPIYTEAFVVIIRNDIIIDCLLVNQTEETFYNLFLEFQIVGSMKITESPKPITLLPRGFSFLKTVIRITTSESIADINGVISYNSVVQKNEKDYKEESIILSPISSSIIDFIEKKPSLSLNFPHYWTLLEWENKIEIPSSFKFKDLKQMLESFSKRTNLLNVSTKFDDQGYIASNFVGSSVFGDDILVNVCLEKLSEGITGQIRLRSQSEKIAMAMGDFIQSIIL